MKVSDYVIDYLYSQKLNHGYFMIGGAIGHIADSCARKEFELYTLHHEQAAAFAAEGQAAATKNLGLAMATSGPGATNLVTGIGSAYFASHPVVFITGQVNTYESNADGKRRQVGFQETDIVSIVKSITKYAVQVTNAADVPYHIEKAIFLARHGRRGPVLVDLPLDIQRGEIEPKNVKHFIGSDEHKTLSAKKTIDPQLLSETVALIQTAKRPVLLIGHGVRLADAEKKLLAFIDKTGIPFVASLMGTDAIPNDHNLYYGFIGTYGQRFSNLAMANSDLVIVLGARLDSRQVGVRKDRFAPMAKIVHVDIDQSELGTSVKEHISFNNDIADFLDAILPLIGKHTDKKEWLAFLDTLKRDYAKVEQQPKHEGIDPVFAIEALSKVSMEDEIVSVDVGSHQMWFAQGWKVKKGQVVLTNGGMGPMGCGLPEAIGACIASGKGGWVIAGDGGFQANIQELQTVVRNKLPLKIAIMNNRALGMLTQFQTENFEGRLIGSVDGYDAPDFVAVAKAYGLPAKSVEKREHLAEAVGWLAQQKGPCLLDIKVPQDYWVFPKSSYARPVHDMKPFLTPSEYIKALKYVDKKALEDEKRG